MNPGALPPSRYRGGGLVRWWRLHARFVVLAGLAALAVTGCTGTTTQPVTPIAVDAAGTAGMVSAYRARHGLKPVRVESRLMEAAATHARLMGQRDQISHSLGGSLPRRIGATGYDWGAAAENLGAGYPTLKAAFAGWQNSPGHQKNLLNPNVTEIGIAAVATPAGSKHRTYWALILATPRPPPSPAGPYAQASAVPGYIR